MHSLYDSFVTLKIILNVLFSDRESVKWTVTRYSFDLCVFQPICAQLHISNILFIDTEAFEHSNMCVCVCVCVCERERERERERENTHIHTDVRCLITVRKRPLINLKTYKGIRIKQCPQIQT